MSREEYLRTGVPTLSGFPSASAPPTHATPIQIPQRAALAQPRSTSITSATPRLDVALKEALESSATLVGEKSEEPAATENKGEEPATVENTVEQPATVVRQRLSKKIQAALVTSGVFLAGGIVTLGSSLGAAAVGKSQLLIDQAGAAAYGPDAIAYERMYTWADAIAQDQSIVSTSQRGTIAGGVILGVSAVAFGVASAYAYRSRARAKTNAAEV